MTATLVRNIHTLVTMNAAREELKNASMLVRSSRDFFVPRLPETWSYLLQGTAANICAG